MSILRAIDVRRRFGATVALDGVDLELEAGRVTALLGVNGAGKTTLMRIMCGLERLDSGSVELASSEPVARVVGYCPQRLVVWPDLGAQEQLVMMGRMYGASRKSSTERALALLERLGLKGRAHSRAGVLSGGMKRRLSIAMALMHDPQILILDEAEVGLDPQSRVQLRGLLRELADDEGKAIVLSTHGIDEVERLADDVVMIERGRVVAAGTPEELVASMGEVTIEVRRPTLEDVFLTRTGRLSA